MAQDCAASLYACLMRVTRLNVDGSPMVGADNMVVSDALARVSWEPSIEEGTEHVQKNGCGAIKASFKTNAQVKRLDVTMDIVVPDPALQQILVGGEILADGDGYSYPPLGELSEDRVSLEVWSRAILDNDIAEINPWIWWVLPDTKWQYGARALAEEFMGLPFTGQANENLNWGNGPANDWPEASDRVVQHLRIDDIPDVACGYQVVAAS